MTDPIHISPDELSRLVIEAALNADEQGYWSGERPIAEDAVEHLVRFLGLLLAGDDDVNPHEMDVFAEVFSAVPGARPTTLNDLREAAMSAVELASDPDALHAFLGSTPAYLRAIEAMDKERGTRNANQVVTALSGLALAILAADGHETVEEDSIFTIHMNHLRGELESLGLGSDR